MLFKSHIYKIIIALELPVLCLRIQIDIQQKQIN